MRLCAFWVPVKVVPRLLALCFMACGSGESNPAQGGAGGAGGMAGTGGGAGAAEGGGAPGEGGTSTGGASQSPPTNTEAPVLRWEVGAGEPGSIATVDGAVWEGEEDVLWRFVLDASAESEQDVTPLPVDGDGFNTSTFQLTIAETMQSASPRVLTAYAKATNAVGSVVAQAQGALTIPAAVGNAQALWDSYAQLYVSPDGDDSNAGTEASPLRTLEKAWSVATPGTSINLAEGTYARDGQLTLGAKPGTSPTQRIVIRPKAGVPLWGCIIRPLAPQSQSGRSTIVVYADFVTFYGLKIEANTPHVFNDGGALSQFAPDDTLRADGTVIDQATGEIGVGWKETRLGLEVFGCWLAGSGVDGLKTGRAQDLRMEGCLIDGDWKESAVDNVAGIDHVYRFNDVVSGRLDGMGGKTGAVGFLIERNLFQWNPANPSRPALAIGGVGKSGSSRPALPLPYREASALGFVVRHNVVLGNAQRDALLQGARQCVVEDNLFFVDGSNAEFGWYSTASASEDSSGPLDWTSGDNVFRRNKVNDQRAGGTKALEGGTAENREGNVLEDNALLSGTGTDLLDLHAGFGHGRASWTGPTL